MAEETDNKSEELEGTGKPEVIIAPTTPREQAISNIVADRLESRGEEFGEGEAVDTIAVEEDVVDDTLSQPETLQEPDGEGEVFTLKVDGQDMTVPADEVIDAGVRTLQKETSADLRLKQARIKEKELLQKEQELAEIERQLKVKPDIENVNPDEFAMEVADSVLQDEEKFASYIKSVEDRLQQVNEETNAIKTKVNEDSERETKDIIHYYHSTYQDISSDPDMHTALNARLAMVAEENPGFSPAEVIDEAANRVYSKFNITREGDLEDPAVKQRKEAKRNMPKRSRRASTRKPKPVEEKGKTRDEILAEMRLRRGVQSY